MGDTKDIIIQWVRSFFKNVSWRKTLTFLFFVLLAFIFWMMQIYPQEYDFTLNMPIKYVNVPDSITFDNELPPEVQVRVKDNGGAIFKYFFTKRNDSLIVDVRDIVKSSQNRIIQGRSIEQLIQGNLFSSSVLTSYSPSRLSYAFTVLHQKKLPVIYDGYINLAAGYLIDGDLKIMPDSVTAYGSKSALDTLRYALTVGDTLNDIKSDKKIIIPMKLTQGVKFTPNAIELSVPVDEFMQKEVEVPVTCVNLPENLSIKIFPSTIKIPLSVGKKRFNDITPEDFDVIINYNDIKNLDNTSISVDIIRKPDYIQTKAPIPAEVEFVLEQK